MVIIKYDFIVCLRMNSKNGLFICVSVYYPVDNFVDKPVDNRCGQRSLKYCLLDLFYYSDKYFSICFAIERFELVKNSFLTSSIISSSSASFFSEIIYHPKLLARNSNT